MLKTKLVIFFLCFSLVLTIKAQYTPSLGLIASYPFNGNANDYSGNTNHGTVYGATLTTDRFNNSNSAYSFDGTSNYISVLDNILNLRPQNFTISAWILFNAEVSTPYKSVLAKNILGATTCDALFMGYSKDYNYNTGWFCAIGSTLTNGPVLNPLFNFNEGVWYNMVYQFDDVNNVEKLFINGAFTASQTVNMSIGYDSNIWTIGAEYENGSLSYYWNGKIDDIAIWDRVLNDSEILSIYQGCSTPTLMVTPSQSVSVANLVQISIASTNTLVSYQWQVNTNTGFSNLINNSIYSGVTTSVLTVVPDAIQANSNLYFRCIVSSSCGTFTSVASLLTVNGVTSINELTKQEKWSIYPNPTKRFFNIQVSSEMIGKQYKLTDIYGKIVLAEKILSDTFYINMEEFREGIYTLSIEGLSDKKVIRVN